jgi:hypothetical protein
MFPPTLRLPSCFIWLSRQWTDTFSYTAPVFTSSWVRKPHHRSSFFGALQQCSAYVKCVTAIALFKKAINQPWENDNSLWCFYTPRFAVEQTPLWSLVLYLPSLDRQRQTDRHIHTRIHTKFSNKTERHIFKRLDSEWIPCEHLEPE